MLWTADIFPAPHKTGHWGMFYTRLSRRDQRKYQRLGLATSNYLFDWRKSPVHWEDHSGPKDSQRVKDAVRQSRAT
ncbi:hypothetical protein Q31a_40680 [Aureliella helgolandensis]|uniref:Uncharacterized protein n=2 Tax=Aureliella helgolandensis TaxID=2527968 RepID=A0A518GAW2_9BACT|nr:hypothetical protein Q31a_40680 [Aureliella helgolandensis]